jgi:hypothetical protein
VPERSGSDAQQRRLFAIIHLLDALRWCAADAHRAAADRVSAELAHELDGLFDDWRAGIPLTASLPRPDQLEADSSLQAPQAEAEARVTRLLKGAASTTPATVN